MTWDNISFREIFILTFCFSHIIRSNNYTMRDIIDF